jgi:hypothetical protein
VLDVHLQSPFNDFHQQSLPSTFTSDRIKLLQTTVDKLADFAVNHMLRLQQQQQQQQQHSSGESISLVRTISPFLCLKSTDGQSPINHTIVGALRTLPITPNAEWWLLCLDGLNGNTWNSANVLQMLENSLRTTLNQSSINIKSEWIEIIAAFGVQLGEFIPNQIQSAAKYLAAIYGAANRRQFASSEHPKPGDGEPIGIGAAYSTCGRRFTELVEGQGMRVLELSETEPIIPFTSIKALFMRIRLSAEPYSIPMASE